MRRPLSPPPPRPPGRRWVPGGAPAEGSAAAGAPAAGRGQQRKGRRGARGGAGPGRGREAFRAPRGRTPTSKRPRGGVRDSSLGQEGTGACGREGLTPHLLFRLQVCPSKAGAEEQRSPRAPSPEGRCRRTTEIISKAPWDSRPTVGSAPAQDSGVV